MGDDSIAIAMRGIEHSLKWAFRKHAGGNPLRPSSIGKPDRQLWYAAHDTASEPLLPHTQIKFLIGNILEHVLLALCDHAGHEVTHQQAKVTLFGNERDDDGIPLNTTTGSIDARIDGELVDAKSTSVFGFKKFKAGKLHEDDPFGYYPQLVAYGQGRAEDKTDAPIGGWLAIDKQNGHITFLRADPEHIPDMRETLDHKAAVIVQEEVPERCYPLEPEGQSGNMKLGINCSYCQYKMTCYDDANDGRGLRAFSYYKGPVFFAKVVKEPNVPEIPLGEQDAES